MSARCRRLSTYLDAPQKWVSRVILCDRQTDNHRPLSTSAASWRAKTSPNPPKWRPRHKQISEKLHTHTHLFENTSGTHRRELSSVWTDRFNLKSLQQREFFTTVVRIIISLSKKQKQLDANVIVQLVSCFQFLSTILNGWQHNPTIRTSQVRRSIACMDNVLHTSSRRLLCFISFLPSRKKIINAWYCS